MTGRKEDEGTLMIDVPEGMTIREFYKVLNAIDKECPGSLASFGFAFPCTFMFYSLSESESDQIYDRLCSEFGEDFVQNKLAFCYDADFEFGVGDQ